MMLLKTLNKESRFFEILPEDWQKSILPYWKSLKKNALIYVLEQNNEIYAGGIVFSTKTPEMDAYKEEADYWFSKNYLYIGYVWVPLEQRNKNYGSLWLKTLLSQHQNQHYWLTTEDKKLKYFYEKLGFKHQKTINYNSAEEDLFVN
jgi:GNAT superfamily N-acetyltransferase